MARMTKEQILALPIADLGLTAQARNHWVRNLLRRSGRGEGYVYLKGPAERKFFEESADQLTVREVVGEMDAQWRESCEGGGPLPRYLRLQWKMLIDKLVGCGLTQLDCRSLPSTTVTMDMLKRLDWFQLRSISVVVLGTLSSPALRFFSNKLNKVSLDITIRELLQIFVLGWERYSRMSFDNTRQKLRELGFRYKDGAFMQDGTRRQLAEDLMAEEGLNRATAFKVAEIAEKRQWVSRFVG